MLCVSAFGTGGGRGGWMVEGCRGPNLARPLWAIHLPDMKETSNTRRRMPSQTRTIERPKRLRNLSCVVVLQGAKTNKPSESKASPNINAQRVGSKSSGSTNIFDSVKERACHVACVTQPGLPIIKALCSLKGLGRTLGFLACGGIWFKFSERFRKQHIFCCQ